jgi:hypothetical protein
VLLIIQLFANLAPPAEGSSAPPVSWSCGHSRLLTDQKDLLSNNLKINITQIVPYNGNELCCYANIPGISIRDLYSCAKFGSTSTSETQGLKPWSSVHIYKSFKENFQV